MMKPGQLHINIGRTQTRPLLNFRRGADRRGGIIYDLNVRAQFIKSIVYSKQKIRDHVNRLESQP